jgi:hypothetical protein
VFRDGSEGVEEKEAAELRNWFNVAFRTPGIDGVGGK